MNKIVIEIETEIKVVEQEKPLPDNDKKPELPERKEPCNTNPANPR
jgi:hypothetical protein